MNQRLQTYPDSSSQRKEQLIPATVEELLNSLTHGLGTLLSLTGLVLLLIQAIRYRDPAAIISFLIFGLSLTLLYLTSTLYHSTRSPRKKHLYKILDHSAIYILIAGTYTPFSLITMKGPWGWTLFGITWGMAILGIFFKVFFVYRFRIISTLLYVGLGWIVLIALKPLVESLAPGGLTLLVTGGVLYTSGVIFYVMKRIPFNHAIWHLFVLSGSLFHFFAVYYYVTPAL